MRRLFISESLTAREISTSMNVPLRTIERDIHDIFCDQQTINHIVAPSVEEMATYVNIFKEQLTREIREIYATIINNARTSAHDRLESYRLISEMYQALFRLSVRTNTPLTIIQQDIKPLYYIGQELKRQSQQQEQKGG